MLSSISGSRFEGVISETGTDYLVLSGATDEKIGFDQIASIDFSRELTTPAEDSIVVSLVDDSVFFCAAYTSAEGNSSLQISDGTSYTIDNRNIRSVQLRSFNGLANLEEQWLTIRATPPATGDAIVVNREGSLETLEGILGEITGERIAFTMDDRSANISRSKIEGMFYFHAAGRELPPALCEIMLTDSSRVAVRTIDVADAWYRITTVSGSEILVPRERVSRMDFGMGRTVFLSDLDPTSSDWQPLMASALLIEQLKTLNLPKTNQSFGGDPLSLEFYPEAGIAYLNERREFEHGFAMKAGSKLVFSLDGKYERLTGLVGFDPEAINGGNLSFRIRCDDRTVLDRNLRKSEMENPLELDVAINDVNRLVFEVDYHDGLEIGDTVHLVDLRVAK